MDDRLVGEQVPREDVTGAVRVRRSDQIVSGCCALEGDHSPPSAKIEGRVEAPLPVVVRSLCIVLIARVVAVAASRRKTSLCPIVVIQSINKVRRGGRKYDACAIRVNIVATWFSKIEWSVCTHFRIRKVLRNEFDRPVSVRQSEQIQASVLVVIDIAVERATGLPFRGHRRCKDEAIGAIVGDDRVANGPLNRTANVLLILKVEARHRDAK